MIHQKQLYLWYKRKIFVNNSICRSQVAGTISYSVNQLKKLRVSPFRLTQIVPDQPVVSTLLNQPYLLCFKLGTETLPWRTTATSRCASTTRTRCGRNEAVSKSGSGSIGAPDATNSSAKAVVYTSKSSTTPTLVFILNRSKICLNISYLFLLLALFSGKIWTFFAIFLVCGRITWIVVLGFFVWSVSLPTNFNLPTYPYLPVSTYLCLPSYIIIPTYIYKHTCLRMSTYQHIPTYVYLPTYVNLPSSTYLPVPIPKYQI